MRVWEDIVLLDYIRGGRRLAREQRDKALDLLDQIGLERELAERYPKELSVGMRKRVEIARALFARPAVLIADEPFHGLDEITRQKLHDLVLDTWHRSNFSVLFSTHDISEALYLADRILVPKQSLPATLSCDLDSPFRRDRHARRDRALECDGLYETILSGMQ